MAQRKEILGPWWMMSEGGGGGFVKGMGASLEGEAGGFCFNRGHGFGLFSKFFGYCSDSCCFPCFLVRIEFFQKRIQ